MNTVPAKSADFRLSLSTFWKVKLVLAGIWNHFSPLAVSKPKLFILSFFDSSLLSRKALMSDLGNASIYPPAKTISSLTFKQKIKWNLIFCLNVKDYLFSPFILKFNFCQFYHVVSFLQLNLILYYTLIIPQNAWKPNK